MKVKLKIPSADKLIHFLKQYKFVLIVVLAGIILLALPTKDKDAPTSVTGVIGGEEDFSVEALEEELGEILSQIEGAGQVSVMLTVRTGMERIFATNQESSERDMELETREDMVVISTDTGEEVVLIGQNYPTFQGALVVCRGGDDPAVKLQITQALSALTGLSSGRITVCKGS